MLYTPLTQKAIHLMFEAHKNQRDKSGLPYVFHPWHVAESMPDEDTTIVALLHDVLEDTDITLEEIAAYGFSKEVLTALPLLCHQDGVLYMDYVAALAPNRIARTVKLSDLRHNSDLTRLSAVTEKDLRRVEKYQKAIEYLEGYT